MSGHLSVATSAPPSELHKLFSQHQHELHLIAIHAYERLYKIGWFDVKATKINLTPREAEIMTWTAQGKTTWEISRIFNTSDQTVKNQLRTVADKLNAKNKTHAAITALKKGLIVLPQDN